MLDSPNSGGQQGEQGGGGRGNPSGTSQAQRRPAQQGSGTPNWDNPKGGDLEDEIPF
jgi:hypothetical protein